MRKSKPILAVIRPRTKLKLAAKLRRNSNGCLVFTGTKNKAGYGFVDVTYGNKRVRFSILAHRLAWVLANGREIPDDRIICHRCNNPSCCNPKHLYAGTQRDNMADKERAGHQPRGALAPKPMLGRTGERHPMSKHTDAQRAEAIAMRAKAISFKHIASVIGCTPATASRWWGVHCAALARPSGLKVRLRLG